MHKKTATSDQLFTLACRLLPGGVNSPVRAFGGVGGNPFFVRRAAGSRIWDVDGNEYLDYVGSWGPMILGHSHARVVRAIQEAAKDGTSFGMPNPHEVRLAQLVSQAFPGIQKVRFVSSGTEATMSAIRLARGFTKRDKVIKFDGCYHGHVDSLLVKAGSGATTFGQPDSAGVPADLARQTISLPFNNEQATRAAIAANKGQIAAIIIEPIPANAGLILPQPGFLEYLRSAATENGILLIFDEVISGFRVARGGAQELYGIKPDLTCLGKIIGGGLPVGAFGGRGDIMDQLAPLGPVYQAGTLSGNPLAMVAGIATLTELFARNPYKQLEATTGELAAGINEAAKAANVAIYPTRVGSIFCSFFTATPVMDYATAKTSDTKKFAAFFHAMLDRGIYLAPSQFEVGFVSLAHTANDIAQTIRAAEEAFKEIQ